MAGNKTLGQYAEQKRFGTPHSLALEGKDYFPILFHADDRPAVLRRLVIERLRERPDFRLRQSLSRAIRIFSLCVVVQHEHRQSRAITGFGVFEHLLIAG